MHGLVVDDEAILGRKILAACITNDEMISMNILDVSCEAGFCLEVLSALLAYEGAGFGMVLDVRTISSDFIEATGTAGFGTADH